MYKIGKLPHNSNITQCFKYDKKVTSKTQIIIGILISQKQSLGFKVGFNGSVVKYHFLNY